MSHLSGIQLTLETAKRDIIIPISIDTEAPWKYAKTYLTQKLDEVRGVEDWLSVQIMIKPIYMDAEYDLDEEFVFSEVCAGTVPIASFPFSK